MRKGFDGLALIVQETLRRDPHSGHLFAPHALGHEPLRLTPIAQRRGMS
jgi:transposase